MSTTASGISYPLAFVANPGSLPAEYVFAPNESIAVEAIRAHIDASGAAGAFYPCLSVYSQDGKLIARVPTSTAYGAGDTGEVTWGPFLRRQTTSPVIGEEIQYAQITTNVSVTSTSEAAPDTIVTLGNYTYNGSDRVELTFFSASTVIAITTPGSYSFVLNLWDDTTDIGRIAVMQNPLTTAVEFAIPIQVSHRLTPTGGVHNYKIRGWIASSNITGRVDAGSPRLPAFLRAIRVA